MYVYFKLTPSKTNSLPPKKMIGRQALPLKWWHSFTIRQLLQGYCFPTKSGCAPLACRTRSRLGSIGCRVTRHVSTSRHSVLFTHDFPRGDGTQNRVALCPDIDLMGQLCELRAWSSSPPARPLTEKMTVWKQMSVLPSKLLLVVDSLGSLSSPLWSVRFTAFTCLSIANRLSNVQDTYQIPLLISSWGDPENGL